ncbi:hypothetical protein DAPPUDRAFT_105007 [Daphnia pulex]|uniref:Uncharacterized protein n=1 Tax=Daphnia pulex TaxID=6669 RepID=E9GP38_DAPPU|nr:hypothetical protein DAPPUDRAFT_105007 [Daphnia pulex]|eukprot:EFX78749.1 hypothetical protein DAPPUDRAFT_105007 [Daphnia pulex]
MATTAGVDREVLAPVDDRVSTCLDGEKQVNTQQQKSSGRIFRPDRGPESAAGDMADRNGNISFKLCSYEKKRQRNFQGLSCERQKPVQVQHPLTTYALIIKKGRIV